MNIDCLRAKIAHQLAWAAYVVFIFFSYTGSAYGTCICPQPAEGVDGCSGKNVAQCATAKCDIRVLSDSIGNEQLIEETPTLDTTTPMFSADLERLMQIGPSEENQTASLQTNKPGYIKSVSCVWSSPCSCSQTSGRMDQTCPTESATCGDYRCGTAPSRPGGAWGGSCVGQ